MRIQHNVMAMNAYRNYNNNTSALSKNLEKLSSGYKINRAGDDAAGLAISEKMRAQIAGLNAAQKNVKDGISLVKTAEGAMQEVQDMLNRMVYLADQSANGTYDNEVDRANLQKEVSSLRTEINRIADSANFNGIKLLDGSLEDGATVGGKAIDLSGIASVESRVITAAATKATFTVDLDGMSLIATGGTDDGNAKLKITIGGEEFESGDITFTGKTADATAIATGFNAAANKDISINGVDFTLNNVNGTKLVFVQKNDPTTAEEGKADFAVGIGTPTDGTLTGVTASGKINTATQVIATGVPAVAANQATVSFNLSVDMLKDGTTIKIGDESYKIDYATTLADATGTTIGVKDLLNEKGELTTDKVAEVAARLTDAAVNNQKFTVGAADGKVTIQSLEANTDDLSTRANVLAQVSITPTATTGKSLVLQIGDTSDAFNQLGLSIKDIHAEALGISGVDISTQAGAAASIDQIKTAINLVSSTRGDLGATQNRLEHTQNNLSVMAENITDAESTIRDTDVADEMMAYTKNNILIQSAQAMLAQANQVPQGVLQLLQ